MEIENGNKIIIAEFMGWNFVGYERFGLFAKKEPAYAPHKGFWAAKVATRFFEYHSSWNWLHPVYRKTIQIGLWMMTNGFEKLWLEKSKDIDHAMLNEDNPSRAANLIAHLIQWYNENKSLNPSLSKQGDK